MEQEFAKTDPKTTKQLREWWASLDEKEQRLHLLALVKLKKTIAIENDGDQGSYFPERSHSFRNWLRAQNATSK
jgi:hypothetical protein